VPPGRGRWRGVRFAAACLPGCLGARIQLWTRTKRLLVARTTQSLVMSLDSIPPWVLRLQKPGVSASVASFGEQAGGS
jgi:hypothetical protein